jgi:hypothetical protein
MATIVQYPNIVLEVTGSNVPSNAVLKCQYQDPLTANWIDIANSDQFIQIYQAGFQVIFPIEAVSEVDDTVKLRLQITTSGTCFQTFSNTYNYPVLFEDEGGNEGGGGGEITCTSVQLIYNSVADVGDSVQAQQIIDSMYNNPGNFQTVGQYIGNASDLTTFLQATTIITDNSICTVFAASGWYVLSDGINGGGGYWNAATQEWKWRLTTSSGLGEG